MRTRSSLKLALYLLLISPVQQISLNSDAAKVLRCAWTAEKAANIRGSLFQEEYFDLTPSFPLKRKKKKQKKTITSRLVKLPNFRITCKQERQMIQFTCIEASCLCLESASSIIISCTPFSSVFIWGGLLRLHFVTYLTQNKQSNLELI